MGARIKEYLEAQCELTKTSFKSLRELGYAYGSINDFILSKGTQFESLSLTALEKDIVAKITKRLRPQKHACFLNSFRFLLNAKLYTEFDWKYVEGYTWAVIAPVYHSWVSLNGKVIDPTLRRYGEFPANEEYFGVIFSPDEYLEYCARTREARAYIDNYWERWPLLKVKRS